MTRRRLLQLRERRRQHAYDHKAELLRIHVWLTRHRRSGR